MVWIRTRLFLTVQTSSYFVETLLASWRIPPKAAMSTWLKDVEQTKRNGGFDFSKPPFPVGVLIGLLHDGFFSFAVVRQLVCYF